MDSIADKADSVQNQVVLLSNNLFRAESHDNLDLLNFLLVATTLIVTLASLVVAVMSLLIAIRSLKYTKRGYKESKRTADNVMRASLNVQKGQFDDLIRHLYRDLVVTLAFSQKLMETAVPEKPKGLLWNVFNVLNRRKNNQDKYPSEEHLLKLKVLPEDINLDNYNDDDAIYQNMHKLKLQFRNYGEEIDTIMGHLKSVTIELNRIHMIKLD